MALSPSLKNSSVFHPVRFMVQNRPAVQQSTLYPGFKTIGYCEFRAMSLGGNQAEGEDELIAE